MTGAERSAYFWIAAVFAGSALLVLGILVDAHHLLTPAVLIFGAGGVLLIMIMAIRTAYIGYSAKETERVYCTVKEDQDVPENAQALLVEYSSFE